MEVVIKHAEESETKLGRKVIKITTDSNEIIYISVEATHIIENLSRQAKIPVIRKRNGWIVIQLNKLIGKKIQVKIEKFRGKEYLSFDWKKEYND